MGLDAAPADAATLLAILRDLAQRRSLRTS